MLKGNLKKQKVSKMDLWLGFFVRLFLKDNLSKLFCWKCFTFFTSLCYCRNAMELLQSPEFTLTLYMAYFMYIKGEMSSHSYWITYFTFISSNSPHIKYILGGSQVCSLVYACKRARHKEQQQYILASWKTHCTKCIKCAQKTSSVVIPQESQ